MRWAELTHIEIFFITHHNVAEFLTVLTATAWVGSRTGPTTVAMRGTLFGLALRHGRVEGIRGFISLLSLDLVSAVHFLQLDLGLLVELGVIDQALNRLNDSFSLAVKEYALHAEEGFVHSAWVVDVDIVVKVLYKHVCEPWVLVSRSVDQEHARFN